MSVRVVCALIFKDEKVLIAQRSALQSNPFKWEFPGGKVKPNESDFDAIVRECKEELAITIVPIKTYKSVEHAYEHINIELKPIVCKVKTFDIQCSEHMDYKFVSWCDLFNYDFSFADKKLIEQLTRSEFMEYGNRV